jgi:hypothetical protein
MTTTASICSGQPDAAASQWAAAQTGCRASGGQFNGFAHQLNASLINGELFFSGEKSVRVFFFEEARPREERPKT